jgi:DNA repair protein RecO (recombination protein O)
LAYQNGLAPPRDTGKSVMTHKTKGIVLRTIKYGETSVVVTLFTELFGVQTYLVNGVRSSKKSSAKANHFQPGAILDLVVYHNDSQTLQRIKEFKWDYLFQEVLSDVIKNSIALYMVELLQKCLPQPEQNAPLFYFAEDVLHQLDKANRAVTANMALYFALHLTHFFGFKMSDECDEQHAILDLQDGSFVSELPAHGDYLDGEQALLTSHLLKVMVPEELADIKLHHEVRRKLLLQYQRYYALHMPDFGQMKTLAILHEVLG